MVVTVPEEVASKEEQTAPLKADKELLERICSRWHDPHARFFFPAGIVAEAVAGLTKEKPEIVMEKLKEGGLREKTDEENLLLVLKRGREMIVEKGINESDFEQALINGVEHFSRQPLF